MSFGSKQKDPVAPPPPPQAPTQASAAMTANGSMFGKQNFTTAVGRASFVNTAVAGMAIKPATPTGRRSLLGGN